MIEQKRRVDNWCVVCVNQKDFFKRGVQDGQGLELKQPQSDVRVDLFQLSFLDKILEDADGDAEMVACLSVPHAHLVLQCP